VDPRAPAGAPPRPGKADQQGLAAGRAERAQPGLAQDLGGEPVGQQHSFVRRQQLEREALRDREIETIAPAQILLPLAVGPEIGAAGLGLHQRDRTGPIEGDEVGAAAVGEPQLGDHHLIGGRERARHAAQDLRSAEAGHPHPPRNPGTQGTLTPRRP
jgi:hypothetical protein